jgi:hypothetical protein
MSTLPLSIQCRTDGEIAIVPLARFNTFYDRQEDGRYVIISQDEIILADGTELAYNNFYAYKTMPSLLEWLKSLNLQKPLWAQ